jgi:hypothetical protein
MLDLVCVKLIIGEAYFTNLKCWISFQISKIGFSYNKFYTFNKIGFLCDVIQTG